MQYEHTYAWPHQDDGEAKAQEFYGRIAPRILTYQKHEGLAFAACCVGSYIHGFLVIVFVQSSDLEADALELSLRNFIALCDVTDIEGTIDYARPILAPVNSMNIDFVLSELESPVDLIAGVATRYGRSVEVKKRPKPKAIDNRPKCYCGSGKRLENCHGFKDRPVHAADKDGNPHPADAHKSTSPSLPKPRPWESVQSVAWIGIVDGVTANSRVILDPFKQQLTIDLAGREEECIFFDKDEGFLGDLTQSGRRRSTPKVLISGYVSNYEFISGFGNFEAVIQVFLSGGAFVQLRDYVAAYIPDMIDCSTYISIDATSYPAGSPKPPLRLIVFRTLAPIG